MLTIIPCHYLSFKLCTHSPQAAHIGDYGQSEFRKSDRPQHARSHDLSPSFFPEAGAVAHQTLSS